MRKHRWVHRPPVPPAYTAQEVRPRQRSDPAIIIKNYLNFSISYLVKATTCDVELH